MFNYIKYFCYLGYNWNWRIAGYIIMQEIKGEKKYGINTSGADDLKKMKTQGIDISHATVYMPATYFQLEEIFEVLPTGQQTHFLDIGCGKGRVLCVAAHKGYSKVTGIDFSKEFCAAASQNLSITKLTFPSLDYTVVNKDAAITPIPTDVDCIFLFNPFDIVIMKQVIKNIITSLQLQPRNLQIVYANPLYKQLFLEINFTEIHYSKHLKYLELSILGNKLNAS